LKTYAEARAMLPDGIIGAEAGPGHHNALLLGEQGADYVAFQFPDQSDDLTWWVEAIEIPSVAIGAITIEQAAELQRQGVEFVTVDCDSAAIAAVQAGIVAETLAGTGN
jgi:thiamine-phosphate pyrophosphorylase